LALYGFPIGGVAAFDPKEGGIISPGGVGFDINCGVRLITTNLTVDEVKPKIKELVDTLFNKVPAGVGCKGFVKVTKDQFRDVLIDGGKWCLDNNYADKDDIINIEDKGKLPGADPDKVSEKAIKRGYDQIGTLGSGNHFLEMQEVKDIIDPETAKTMFVNKKGQVCFMIHCGSRGLGHQVGTDYLRKFLDVMPKHGINILDRELACAPMESQDGQDYYAAMACAANMAFANRQVILHRVREVFSRVFDRSSEDMEMKLVYDVCHNIAKLEKYKIDGKMKELVVHRKGATRAFGPARADSLPSRYANTGQPVILPGSMQTGSWLLAGTDKADAETFASTAHGAGRIMSRMAAKKQFKGEDLQKEMLAKGIYVHGVSMKGLAEEAGGAYKDINSVVNTLETAGVTKRVASFWPFGNIKG
jgi:tRNA-splicing ligase RtcB (3'-phosphate/5'-hydroxy nucleic acid ligase)